MLLNRFFRLEMVKGDPNHHPRTLNAPFRAARHPGVQNNKTGSIHVCTPVALNILVTNQMHEFDNRLFIDSRVVSHEESLSSPFFTSPSKS